MRTNALANRGADFGAKRPDVSRPRRTACARAIGVHVARVREHAALLAAVEPPSPPGARFERLHTALPRQRRRHAAPLQKREDAGGRRLAAGEVRGAKRADLRRERDAPGAFGDVQRLDAEAVAGDKERSLHAVPAGKREHAAHVREPRGAAARDQAQQDFGVAAGGKTLIVRFQVRAQRSVVVDFAVEHDVEPAVGRGHGLRAARAGIDDREPPVHQQDTGVRLLPDAGAVGPAVRQRPAERGGQRRDVGQTTLALYDAPEATH